MSLLAIERDRLTLDGKPFYLASGDMHYFRVFPGGWRRRLELMKDFGLTAVQTYVPWNLHEPKPGVYDFSGMLDLGAFLRLCDEVGLKVLLRPSCYICSEWDMGGLPSWLLKTRDIVLRSSDPRFMEPARRYMKRLSEEFLPYLSTNGGPIIAVAVENEYGSYGNDRDYLRQMTDLMRELGVDVPLYATDGADPVCLANGACDRSVW
ncbi:MAG: beta-galactosidase, partial [Clostridia bacterium]|nr:beta-galactosidase [Clostridia bacterium]